MDTWSGDPAFAFFHDSFSGTGRMRKYSPGRGRKKGVKKFTNRKGLWMLGILSVIMIGILLLILRYLNVDMD
jgi:hypothetical protein